MQNISRRQFSAGAISLSAAGCATTGTQITDPAKQYLATPVDYFDATPAPFPQFAVAPEKPSARFDFSHIDAVLQRYVIDLGPSDRFIPGRRKPGTGSRFVKGHESDYRLEGSRIAFAALRKKDRELLSRMSSSLISMGNQKPLSNYSWLDQVSFWMNLHNALIISQLAQNYPTAFPAKLKVGQDRTLLHDAKLVVIQGTPLSLRDIRAEIIYRHWRESLSVYGFFHGVVGGPKLPRRSYSASDLPSLLGENADEFINSLRGVRKGNGVVRISKLYGDALPLFANLETDLRPHLKNFAKENVASLLNTSDPLELSQFEDRISDFSGGDISLSSSSFTPSTGVSPSGGTGADNEGSVENPLARITLPSDNSRLPPHAKDILVEIEQKGFRLLRSNGFKRKSGIVVIDDLPTDPTQ